MQVNFFDDELVNGLYPLTLTRPSADLRCGIVTLAEKWMRLLPEAESFGHLTRPYLAGKFKPAAEATLYINGRLLAHTSLLQPIKNLTAGQFLSYKGQCLAYHTRKEQEIVFEGDTDWISRPYDLFAKNAVQIQQDFERLTLNRYSAALSETNRVLGSHPVFLEEGAKVECCILNTKEGPVYVGKNAEIMEGSLIRGPFAMGEGSVVKMGAKIYTGTTLGPYCNAGGEISNVVFWGYSNKGHDGFLGNAVLGEWCNVGADSNCSNLKNTYDEVKVWNYSSSRFDKSGLQFCGVIMGDHSKCGINTMFNTGTVVGVCCNVFGHGFPRQFIPDFSWGGATGMVTHKPDAAFKTAALVMPRRKRVFDDVEQAILSEVFEISKNWRNWES